MKREKYEEIPIWTLRGFSISVIVVVVVVIVAVVVAVVLLFT